MSQQSYSPKQESTRLTLMHSAFELFAEKGYANTSTREIAERAGVNEVTLFRNFKSKYNLFLEATMKFCPIPPAEQIMAENRRYSFQEGLRRLEHGIIANLRQNFPQIRLMMLESATSPEIRNILAQVPITMRHIVAEHLRRGQREGYVREGLNLELMASYLLWLNLAYVMTTSLHEPEVYPFEQQEVLEGVLEVFLRGLHPDAPAPD
jgi:AcrR family transcriptional regulator